MNVAISNKQKAKIIIQQIDEIVSPQKFVVEKGKAVVLLIFISKTTDYQVQVCLEGEGAQADILGIVLGTGTNKIIINTVQDHQAPNTRSNLLIKSALSGKSTLKYEGLIRVAKQAQKTDAYQRNENLMLSNEAKTETKPALEIIANDVRCTHSATISKVDPEQLFYLKTRGVNEEIANQLIIEGFFQSILEKIEDEKVKESVAQQVKSLVLSLSSWS